MARKDTKKAKTPPAKNRILFITYFFPPTAGGGVFRPLAMTKYLSRLGWDITVITATTPKHYPTDHQLEIQIPESVRVKRIPVTWEGSLFRRALGKLGLDFIPRSLITPDERIFWANKAFNLAKRMIDESGFDVIYTTGPPFSILLDGLWLRRIRKIPWLAEFRDPWTLAPYLATSNPHHRRFARDAEREVIETADGVVMVTPTFAQMMREKYPAKKDRIFCVPNGYDMEDFARVSPSKSKNEACTVLAAGTVFGRYNLDDFLSGLELLKKNSRASYEKLKVVFQGLPDYKFNQRLLELGLNDRCFPRGFVEHSENISNLCSADLLVLALNPVPNYQGHIPSRTYEFLASGTPILAICPDDGDLAELLSSFPQVIMIHPGDPTAVMKALEDAVNHWELGKSPKAPGLDSIKSLSRKVRAEEMDAILKNLISANRGEIK